MVETHDPMVPGSAGDGPSSDPAGDDPELAAALDSFVDWARQEEDAPELRRLPPLQLSEGIHPGAILGDYELVRRLGVGGMGVVFEGRQLSVLGRRVAVKVLRSFFATERLAKRFQREIATVAELDHPGIVPIVDAQVTGGTPYYVMKYVEGLPLSEVLKKLRHRESVPEDSRGLREWVGEAQGGAEKDTSCESGETTSWESSYTRWVARLGLQLAEALQYAHDHGYVHRDVKPGNIVVTPQGRPVLLDFGLATDEGDDPLTRTGEFLGTLAYASPEQVQGRHVDVRADVYSLGATLFELLALRRPYEAHDRSELLRRIERGDPPRLGREVPVNLRTLVSCALSRAPGQRYATAGEMAQDLRSFLAGKPIQKRPPGIFARALQWTRSHPLVATAAGVTALLFSGLRAADHVRAAAEHRAGLGQLELCQASLAQWNEDLRRYVDRKKGPPTQFLELEELRSGLHGARLEILEDFEMAEATLVGAFAHVADYGPARRELANLHAGRLMQALEACEDVAWPDRIEHLEESLRRYDAEGRHAALLGRRGSIELFCDDPEAVVEVFRDGAESEPIYRGTLPYAASLAEGSYRAQVSAPGRSPACLPFLVRRNAAYASEHARPSRQLRVRLLASDEVPPGFVYVPAGETFVSNDPPVWEWVEGFLVQEYETTYANLLDWSARLERQGADGRRIVAEFERALPRDSQGLHLERGDQGFLLRADLDPELPVRGIEPLDLGSVVNLLEFLAEPRPEGWHVSLPRVAEWTRAARGADGRHFPWGYSFESELSVNYLSAGFFGHDAQPLPVGHAEGDVSPFGVHDLAGSAAELTCDLQPPLPGHYLVCGGSFRSVDPRDMITTSKRSIPNDRFLDIGFRFVLRPLPGWYRLADEDPRAFQDDFERPDSEDVEVGWIEIAGVPFAHKNDPTETEQCSVQDGRLVCIGGEGDFSDVMSALQRVHVSEAGYVARATIRATCALDVESTLGRGPSLRLTSGFLRSDLGHLNLSLSFDGRAGLNWAGCGEPRFVPFEGPDATRDLVYELRVEGKHAQGRIWPVGAQRPVEPQASLELPSGYRRPRYLLLQAPNYVGARVEVDQVSVEPLP